MKIKALRQNRKVIQKPVLVSSLQNLIILAVMAIGFTIIFYLVYSSSHKDDKPQTTQEELLIEKNHKANKAQHYEIIQTIKRNSNNPQYTQGLVFINATTLLESAGLYSHSKIHTININQIDKFVVNKNLGKEYFAEGCDIINNKIYQLTWRERKIFIWDVDTLESLGDMEMDAQVKAGWGITHRVVDGKVEVFMTDGSHYVYVADENLKVHKKIPIINAKGQKVQNLNELEYANGYLYANVYLTSHIIAINIDEQKIHKVYDFTQLKQVANPQDSGQCLNGIAYHKENDTFWLTGKEWPYFWEVRLN